MAVVAMVEPEIAENTVPATTATTARRPGTCWIRRSTPSITFTASPVGNSTRPPRPPPRAPPATPPPGRARVVARRARTEPQPAHAEQHLEREGDERHRQHAEQPPFRRDQRLDGERPGLPAEERRPHAVPGDHGAPAPGGRGA